MRRRTAADEVSRGTRRARKAHEANAAMVLTHKLSEKRAHGPSETHFISPLAKIIPSCLLFSPFRDDTYLARIFCRHNNSEIYVTGK